VGSAIIQIKATGKIDQNAYILRYKAKIKEKMFCWKKVQFRRKSRTFEIYFRNYGNTTILRQNGIKYVRFAIIQIKTIGEIDQNAYILG